jgi:hypothetical protein
VIKKLLKYFIGYGGYGDGYGGYGGKFGNIQRKNIEILKF